MSPPDNHRLKYNFWSLLSVFLISVVMIGLQLALMRALSVARYYHFSYLVISTALLGFGASGTFLCFFYDWMVRRSTRVLHLFFVLFLASIPAGYLLAQTLPIDIQYILLDRYQGLLMLLYNFLIFIPFFLGATLIGFFLTYFKRNVSRIYGANLLGSGTGGILILLLMFLISPAALPLQLTIMVFLAYLSWIISNATATLSGPGRIPTYIGLGISVLITVFSLFYPVKPHIDPHKSLAQMQRLEKQSDANHLMRRYSPRGQIDVYEAPSAHYTLFAGLQTRAMPPPQLPLLIDGSMAGTIFRIKQQKQAAILDYTPQSMPYRLCQDSARVLLLGASGGTSIWLARRFDARHITVVQTNPQLVSIMRNELDSLNGKIYEGKNLTVVSQSPRHYLEQTHQKFDIIQWVRAETMGAGTGGMQSLNENYLLTVEAIREAYRHLTDPGFLSITRGIETPPRDNIKIFALMARALKTMPSIKPAQHLLQGRNYLAVNTLLRRSPLDSITIARYRSQTDSLMMDPDYYPGVDPKADATYNQVGGPDGKPYSWYYHAARQILHGNAQAFYQDWVYNVRPPTDNRPYFNNFFKWSSLARFQKTYGKYWLQKLELGFVVLLLTLLEITIIAFVLILLPLILRRTRLLRSGHTIKTLIFFTATGFGFIFLEMVFIQKFGRFMGDPIYSTAAALTSMLVFAGLGSSIHEKLPLSAPRKLYGAGAILILVTLLYLVILDPFFEYFSNASTPIRFLLTCLLLLPPSFILGWFFPIGIQLLQKRAPLLVPWAWGIDGFTSVAGAPLALLLSMMLGLQNVLLIGLSIYIILLTTVPFWNNQR